MGIRKLFVSSAMAFLLASALPVTPVGAADGTPCTMEFDLNSSPGLSASPSSGTFTTNGETGTISCDGPVNGKQPTGPGTIGVDGRYGDKKPTTCYEDAQGGGTFTMTIPTSDGAEHITNNFVFTRGSYTDGVFTGAYEGDRMSGTFQAQPTEGDCVTKPMTKFHVKGKGTLH